MTPEPPKDIPKPEAQLNIPAVTTSAGVLEFPGALAGLPSVPLRRGVASAEERAPARGAALGRAGIRSWARLRVAAPAGAFTGRATAYMPSVLTEVKPSYTADAMRAKIQGVVMVEAVVLPDGGVGQVRVIRSLDPDLRSRSGSHQSGPALAFPS